ncbi:WXG100 family type VII secretion target [Nocardia beijingensis]|uniref:WXG100 family type VII secretion target n=1 Tax=Nocardia beijingensis TaxID=95162 RepID=UPI003316568C
MVYVDPAVAKKAQETLAAAVDNMRSTLNKIDSEVHAAQGWQGDARQAFAAAAANWGDNSQKLHQALDRLTQQVGHGSKKYVDMEIQNHQEFVHLTGLQ